MVRRRIQLQALWGRLWRVKGEGWMFYSCWGGEVENNSDTDRMSGTRRGLCTGREIFQEMQVRKKICGISPKATRNPA